MINIKNLTYKIDNLTIFDNANIHIPKNKITVVIGANGIGKTSLLKILSEIIKPQKIEIEKNYKEIFYLPQKIKYPSCITLFEYLESFFYKDDWKWFLSKTENEKIEKILILLDLMKKKDVQIDNLSAGELQKVNIALGLISEADLFLLDEPTSNMDLINQINVLKIIEKLTKRNITFVIVMHDINILPKFGDYFIGITPKNKIIQNYKKDFISPDILKEIYGIDFQVIKDDEKINIQICN